MAVATRLLAAVAALALVGGASVSDARTKTAPEGTYLVAVAPGAAATAARLVSASGGRVERTLPQVGVVVARLPVAAAEALAQRPGVTSVTRDRQLRLASSSYDAKADANSLYNIEQVIGARGLWSSQGNGSGLTGAGIDIALIDSGVAPVPGLDSDGKIVHGPDLSFDSQNPKLAHLDTFGHGTHLAGIIAGRDAGIDPSSGVGNADAFLGVAPKARIVSVKVADPYGVADVSQVIAAIDWVVQYRRSNGLNIRVLNLSFATPSAQSYTIDPLCHAVEVAWRKGIVVVVSAGNDGTNTGRLLNPAQDPHVLAVGADDSLATIPTDDDVIPAFSSRGDGIRNPDLVAPGRSLQSLRVPGSYVDVKYGSGPGSINTRFLRGSGTSQAAAVVSGATALLLQARPSLTPDGVKSILMKTARRLPAADPQAQGSGIIDLRRAVDAAVSSLPTPPRGSGTGSLDAARGGVRLSRDGVQLDGERDIFGAAYDAAARAAAREADTGWSGGSWNGNVWTGSTWAGSTWAGSTWAGSTWAGSTWAGSTWADGTWTGSTWAYTTWAGSSWAGSTWAQADWSGATWAVGEWR